MSRVGSGAIINRFRADEYDLYDDEGELAREFKLEINEFYKSQIKGNSGHSSFDEISVDRWVYGRKEEAFSTGWWLYGAHNVLAKGGFDYCCNDRNCKLSNVNVDWEWYDDIDAHDFMEALDVYEARVADRSWWQNRQVSIVLSLEVFWDVIGDKVTDTDFKVNIKWKESRKSIKVD